LRVEIGLGLLPRVVQVIDFRADIDTLCLHRAQLIDGVVMICQLLRKTGSHCAEAIVECVKLCGLNSPAVLGTLR
jgi:hypothetical protein